MSKPAEQKPVSAIEPLLLFAIVAVFATIVAAGLVSGWVWIPAGRTARGTGSWVNRADHMRDYVVYLIIMSGAVLLFLKLAVDRLRRYNAQTPPRR